MSPEKKIRWTTIKVPVELRDVVKALAQRYSVPENKILWWSVAFFYEQIREPRLKEDLPQVDKASWYISKLAMSVGAFKENPSVDNLQKLQKTAMQVAQRLGVDTRHLIRAAQDYARYQDTDTKIELNAALKMVVLDIIWKVLKQEDTGPFSLLEYVQRLAEELEERLQQ